MTELRTPPGAPGAPAASLGTRYAVPSGWQVATLVGRRAETPSAATLVLEIPGWPGHLAGQHIDLRLTAPDGYTAERSYSIANGPTLSDAGGSPLAAGDRPTTGPAHRVEVTVQQVPDGEVSPYLVDDFPVGARIEVRGPIGGWFVWSPEHNAGTPVLLLAGGSGLVPLMAMMRARRAAGDRTPFRIVCSVRRPEDRLYAAELDALAAAGDGLDLQVVYTRAVSLANLRGPRRLTPSELAAWGWPAELSPRVFVCGPTGFVEAVSRMLVAQGHDPADVRTERFGPASA